MDNGAGKWNINNSDSQGNVIGEHNTIYQYFQVPEHSRVTSRHISFVSLIADKTENFVGRDFVFKAIKDFINTNKSGYFLIEGEPGIGKTAILAELVKREGYPHHFNVVLQNIRTPKQFLFNACAQLIARYNLDYEFIPDEAGNDSVFFVKCLEEAANVQQNRPVVFVIDALDELDRTNPVPHVNPLYLPSALPDGVFLVLSSRVTTDLNLQVSNSKPLFLEPNSEGNLLDIQLYIRNFLLNSPQLQKRITAWKISEADFINAFVEKSEGNFIYLHYVLPEIAEGRFLKGTVEELPQGLQAYYNGHWQQMQIAEPDSFSDLYEPIVCLLAVVQEPVTVGQVHLWTKKDTSRIQLAMDKWREFLKAQKQDGEIKFRIYHVSFQEFLSTKIDLKKYDQLIAEYYLSKLDLL